MKKIIVIVAVLMTLQSVAINVKNKPHVITQPDGTKIECFITGDEFGGMIHDAEGYAFKRDQKTDWWYYAIEIDGKITCSEIIVGKTELNKKSLKKGLMEFNESFYKDVTERRKANKGKFKVSGGVLKSGSGTTTINTIVIFIRFDGGTEFVNDRNYYTPYFNSTSEESLKDYFQEVSYNQLDINSTFYPLCASNTNLSYEDDYIRGYYIKKDDDPVNGYDGFPERKNREHGLLKRAVEAIASSVPTSINLDANNDGKVDHVCFIVRGGSANIEPEDLLWPHEWSLYSQSAYINSKRVYEYTFMNSDKYFTKETLCHEFFHVLGAPDLYHPSTYKPDIEPAGYWDIMAERNDNFPHMGAYMKYEYGGWINSIPEITENGIYSIKPITSSTDNCYKIKSPYNCDEYFIVEYRKQSGDYEGTIQGNGLLVYRINPSGDNYYGPNDEVYIYRPNGTLTANGTGYNAYFSSQAGRTAINDNSNPNSFLCDGSDGGLSISNIGSSGTTISFTVDFVFEVTGADLVCIGGSQYTGTSAPSGYNIGWVTSSNLEVSSGGGTNTPVVKAKYSSSVGEGWIQSSYTKIGTSCTVYSTKKTVWVGAPKISNIDGSQSVPNNQWAYYTAELESSLSAPTDYNWILNPLNGNSVYDYGVDCDIAFYNSGDYQLVVQAKNTCSSPNFGPYYVTGIYVYDSYSMIISPNPATTEATITIAPVSSDDANFKSASTQLPVDQTTEWEVEVYSTMQKLKAKQTKIRGNSTTVNTQNWKEGVYTVRAKYKGEVLTGKLVVKK